MSECIGEGCTHPSHGHDRLAELERAARDLDVLRPAATKPTTYTGAGRRRRNRAKGAKPDPEAARLREQHAAEIERRKAWARQFPMTEEQSNAE